MTYYEELKPFEDFLAITVRAKAISGTVENQRKLKELLTVYQKHHPEDKTCMTCNGKALFRLINRIANEYFELKSFDVISGSDYVLDLSREGAELYPHSNPDEGWYKQMKMHELRSLCKERGIKTSNKDKKTELIDKLNGEGL